MLKRTFTEAHVISSYSKVGWFYNFWSYLTESKTLRMAITMADLKDGEAILEVAVGTGIVFNKLVSLNIHGINEGVDISPDMLNRAKKLLKHNENKNYHLQLASAYHLPFKSNSFDIIISNYMFDLLPEDDFNKVLSEFHRVLKSPGRIIIATMSFGFRWYHKFWYWVAKFTPSLLTGCRPVSLADFMKKAGFSNTEKALISQNTLPSDVLKALKI
jgi:ubiquinone/menaquinone biosynthesis C-methylase UbiE